MPSPFPGMNPYIESPVFWSSFHARLIVAIADTLAPDLRPTYYIDVETRTYQDDDVEDDLLVGIPDAAVMSAKATENAPSRTEVVSRLTSTQKRPQSITLPLPTTIRERYLEIRELGSDLVIAVIEVLSPKNKQKGKGRTAYERKRARSSQPVTPD